VSELEVELIVLQRILLLVLALFVVWRLLVALGRRVGRSGHGADSFSRFSAERRRRRQEWEARRRDDRPDELVACSRCGTYVPSRRALSSGSGAVYCSPSCRDRVEAAGSHES